MEALKLIPVTGQKVAAILVPADNPGLTLSKLGGLDSRADTRLSRREMGVLVSRSSRGEWECGSCRCHICLPIFPAADFSPKAKMDGRPGSDSYRTARQDRY